MECEGAGMREDGKIDYLELPARALAAFSVGLDGGFDGEPGEGAQEPLPVLYATDLEAMRARVEAAGGTVLKPIYAFPGGRRFHFRDPAGNELAVWSET
jgi:predicted enzyme related to lactoylglutathione lyase